MPWYLPDHDALVVTAKGSDGTVCIIDVAAREIPSIPEILVGIGAAPSQLEVQFPPDRIGWTGRVVPAETSTVLMVRGDLEQVEPFMLPGTAAF